MVSSKGQRPGVVALGGVWLLKDCHRQSSANPSVQQNARRSGRAICRHWHFNCWVPAWYRRRLPIRMFRCLGHSPWALCGLHRRQPALARFAFFRLWCIAVSDLCRCALVALGRLRVVNAIRFGFAASDGLHLADAYHNAIECLLAHRLCFQIKALLRVCWRVWQVVNQHHLDR